MELSLPQAFQKAVESQKAGRVEEARQLYLAILHAQPTHPVANFNMGMLAVGIHKLQAALPFFKIAFEVKPNNAQFVWGYVVALIKLGHLTDAKSAFKKAKANGAKSDALDQLEKKLNELKSPQDGEYTIESFRTAIKKTPNAAHNHYNLALALNKAGDSLSAIKSFRQAINIKPNYTRAHDNLAASLISIGDLNGAIKTYKDIMRINPGYAAAYNNLGVALQKKGDLDAAIESYKQTIKIKPDYAAAYNNLGVALKEKGNHGAAIESYNQAIKIKPDYADAYNNLGVALGEKGDLGAAIESYKQAIKIKPDYPEAYHNLGNSLKENGGLDAAIESYNQAIEIRPDFAEAYSNLGVALGEKGDLDAAIESYKQAIKIRPDFAEAYSNLGVALGEKGDLDAAIESYKQAIKIRPDYAEAHNQKSFSHLSQMDFKSGWSEYEWRWNVQNFDSRPLSSFRPLWDGQINKRVLLWPEQGIGDEIMFMSVAQELAAQCARLIIKMDYRLIPLFRRSFGSSIDIVATNVCVDEEEYDFHIPMGSALKFFRNDECDFEKTSGGVLRANLEKVEEFKREMNITPEKALIGLSWGSVNKKIGARKSISLESLLSKFDPNFYEFVNLQYGDVLEHLERARKATGITIHQIASVNNREDIDDLSAIIAACDYVISISNVTAHLAGALGKNTHILLHYAPEWRWQLNRTDSPWYKSVTLHRQENFDDWAAPLEALKQYFDIERGSNLPAQKGAAAVRIADLGS